ncbi:unnamed protein product [Mycena citricolor]|uniref:Uncharacterized protein n=1 Tax=Mycena citricolor TaxID=2018698 RepID=A0AAD2HUT2_9AGAR|nr:unnamed protein product [Mycena citricolor]
MYPINDTSSGGSTPQATYASSTSSPSSSCFSFDFPQPPVSPALRRMQSSPLFTAEETDAVREFLRRRWGAQIHAKARRIVDAAEPGLAVDTNLRELDFSWYAASPTTDAGSPREQQLELELELAGEALVQAPPPCHRLQSTRSTEHMGRDGIRPLHCGRVLRRAASLAAPESPLLTFETLPPVPSLVGHSAAAPRRQHRTALSVPLAGWVPVTTERPGGRRETSFMPGPILDRNIAPRSFMDLTPERDIRPRQDKNRVKKLLARASSSFAGLFSKAKK